MAKSPFNLAALALVINHPHDAAGMVTSVKDHGTNAIDGVVQLFRDLGN
ncbi:hypothetical protein [Amycolatopsis sp. NPDC004625]